ncbi:MAG TPA: BlaI/MecI/CopY family transcriptional regulator, partial [Thermoanaerobaculia bacterium]|nr:BlaI/MecI/CopY family transcriptional regulator [Thermoanaerobaculia bacterium]
MTRRKKKAEELKELSDLELAVMDVVWQAGECSSAEVVERFQARRPLAATTIRTVLASIERKGYLERVPTVERGLRYRPRVPRDAVAGRSLRKLVTSLFEGSPRNAMAYLLRDS